MNDHLITINSRNIQKTLDILEKNPAISQSLKNLFKDLILTLCGQPRKLYKPGDLVRLSGPGISGITNHLVCVTGDAKVYRAVRFCSTTTGRKAGDSFSKPYQLAFGIEGVSAEQIEAYLDNQYKVVD